MKINKENVGYIFIIVLLTILLGLSIYLGLSGWYFYSDQNYSTDLQLGKTMETNVKGSEAMAVSLNLQGSYLPGEALPQVIAINNADTETIMLRVKVYLDSGEGDLIPVKISTTQLWQFREEDGYYYYTDNLTSFAKCSFCSGLFMPDNAVLQTTKKYMVTFVIESLKGDQDVVSIWGYSP